MDRFPAARPAGLGGERRISLEPCVHGFRVTEHERRVEIRLGDPGMQREDAFSAIAAFVRGGFDERVHGGVEFEG